MSPDLKLDIAADEAIESVLRDGFYKELSKEYFDFPYFWENIRDMEDDIEEFWKDDVIVDEAVLKQAREYLQERRPQTQIRVGVQMKLAKYEKNKHNGKIYKI